MDNVSLKDIILALESEGKEYHTLIKDLKKEIEIINLKVESYDFKIANKDGQKVLLLCVNYHKSLLQSICRLASYNKVTMLEIPFAMLTNEGVVFIYDTKNITLLNKEHVRFLSEKILTSSFAINIECGPIYSKTKLDDNDTSLKLQINKDGFLASFSSNQHDNNYFDYIYYDSLKNQLKTVGNMWSTNLADLNFLLENTLFLTTDFPTYHQRLFVNSLAKNSSLMIETEEPLRDENAYSISVVKQQITLTRTR